MDVIGRLWVERHVARGTSWELFDDAGRLVASLPGMPYDRQRSVPWFGFDRVAWITHRQHHAHANDPERDPDISSRGETWWRSAIHSLRARQPGDSNAYARVMRETDDPNRERALLEAFALRTTHFSVLAICAWSGYALEACFVWWLPRHLGFVYIQLFLSWAPHHPMEETGRYRDTRAWKSPVGTILSMGMEYHIIHHLFPRIPLFQTGPAYHEMRQMLDERGCPNERPERVSP